jgi:UDP-N-acetylmuramate--alanine ligase
MHIRSHSLKNIHFVGIGGIGMSGIAEILHNLGFYVQGSDASTSPQVKRLKELGIPVFHGHDPSFIHKAQVVVTSTAIASNNVEVLEARRLNIPVVRRVEMLAEIMHLKHGIAVSGTHGKTSTTSLIAALLDAANLDPTVINGGVINTYGSNARLGKGQWVVAEADESDGSFTKIPATIAIVTNIDPEHLDHYGSFEALKAEFKTFIEKIPFYGLAIVCSDHPVVSEVCKSITDRRIITYGKEMGAHLMASNIRMDQEGMVFDVLVCEKHPHRSSMAHTLIPFPKHLKAMRLSMYGEHNVLNALAAMGVALELGLDEDVIRRAFKDFRGVHRRFTVLSTHNNVTLVDDYAHHPIEMRHVVETAKKMTTGKLHVVMQPHRYSRLQHLFDDFATCVQEADSIYVAPVYAANESPIEGICSRSLVDLMVHKGFNAHLSGSPESLGHQLLETIQPSDYVVCMGAGSITQWCSALKETFENTPLTHTLKKAS